MHLVFCPGGLPPLPLDLGPARGVAVLLDFCLLHASTLSLRLLLRELAKGELFVRSGLFYARCTPRLTFTIPRRTFDDVGNCGSLWRFTTAFYPLVVSDLRVVVGVWIRERFASGGGLRTAPALDVCALDYGETGIDSLIDNGLAVAALGVPGRSRLTATSQIVQRACSLPAGEIGVTASGYTLSLVALVIASGHAGDYLPLLAARGQGSQDSWPDVKHRRLLRQLSLSLLLFLKCRWQFLLRLEALFFIVTSVCSAGSCQVLFCACQDPLPWERFAVLRVGLRRLLGLGSVVPVDFCSWCSHFWCCDCDSCAGIDGRLSSSPSGEGVGSVSCTLDAFCIDRFPVNHGLF